MPDDAGRLSSRGVTRLAVVSILMMPQLGVLADIHPLGAAQVFERDCLVHLGTAISPRGRIKDGEAALTVKHPQGELKVKRGELHLLPAQGSSHLENLRRDFRPGPLHPPGL